jgi:hypothetical protein
VPHVLPISIVGGNSWTKTIECFATCTILYIRVSDLWSSLYDMECVSQQVAYFVFGCKTLCLWTVLKQANYWLCCCFIAKLLTKVLGPRTA